MRTPRLTLASDGKPLRRLLVASKPVFEVLCFGLHDTPPQCDPQGGAADYRLPAGPVKSGFGRLTNQANRRDEGRAVGPPRSVRVEREVRPHFLPHLLCDIPRLYLPKRPRIELTSEARSTGSR